MRSPVYSPNTLEHFIVFEGLDGAGTSTQAALLQKGLKKLGVKVNLSSEPTTGPVGTLIKQIMRGRLSFSEFRNETEKQLAYLFAADRHDHLYNDTDGLVHLISRDYVTISTRYFFSSYAYNARTTEDLKFIERLNLDFPLPQVIVYLKVPLEESLRRLDKRELREFYEREDELKRVAANYKTVFRKIRDRVIEVETSGDVNDTAATILEEVVKRLEIKEEKPAKKPRGGSRKPKKK